jgi:hypothetical protein
MRNNLLLRLICAAAVRELNLPGRKLGNNTHHWSIVDDRTMDSPVNAADVQYVTIVLG